MKNLFKLFGIIALVAIIGFSMSACKDPEPEPDPREDYYGTWKFASSWTATMVISETNLDITDTDGDYLHFTISSWATVNNTDNDTKTDYPNGYKLTGTTTSNQGYESNTVISIYIHTNKQSVLFSNVYIKQ